MFEGFKEHLVSGEVDIHARVGGQGSALLLLHGFPQNLFEWARVAPLLAERYTVVCTDLRGYGKSGKPPAEGDAYSFRAMARDQVAVMKALGFDRFHVVGHDRGARTAHRLALDHPEAVISLALLDIVPTLEMFANANAEVARAYWHWFFLQQPFPYPEKLIEASPDHFYEGFFSTLGNMRLVDFDQAQLEAYRCAWRDPGFFAPAAPTTARRLLLTARWTNKTWRGRSIARQWFCGDRPGCWRNGSMFAACGPNGLRTLSSPQSMGVISSLISGRCRRRRSWAAFSISTARAARQPRLLQFLSFVVPARAPGS